MLTFPIIYHRYEYYRFSCSEICSCQLQAFKDFDCWLQTVLIRLSLLHRAIQHLEQSLTFSVWRNPTYLARLYTFLGSLTVFYTNQYWAVNINIIFPCNWNYIVIVSWSCCVKMIARLYPEQHPMAFLRTLPRLYVLLMCNLWAAMLLGGKNGPNPKLQNSKLLMLLTTNHWSEN